MVAKDPARNDYEHGWYQVAFEGDLAQPISPLTFAGRALMAIRDPEVGQVRIFDAVCPHRGAHLAYGGRLAGHATVVCPFHGHRIGLGEVSPEGFCTRGYASLVHGGGVFVRLSDQTEPDLARGLQELGAGHTFIPGFEMTADTSIEVVIENGFDNAHFRAVHGLLSLPGLVVRAGPFGELLAEGRFEIPWRGGAEGPGVGGGRLQARYLGHAFSPGTFIAELDGDPPYRYRMMTTATPSATDRACTIRFTLILPNAPDGSPPEERFTRDLLEYSREGLERDRAIWNRLDPHHVPRLTSSDQAAIAFGQFCRRFRNGSA
jgi:3-ketosteroid 9alpha-monooxygenase subunit A